jgi:hypothetical protein
MPNKQGYLYIMAHMRLFLLRKGIIECFSAVIVFLKVKKSQYCQYTMHANKDAL